MNTKGSNPKTLKRIIKEYNLNEDILKKNRKDLFSQNAIQTHLKTTIPIEKIIFENKYPDYQTSKLAKRLVEEGFKEYKCERCGINQWLNNKISLQLHHKDGDRKNNYLNNLQLLCPNCHSQTDNFAGKQNSKLKNNKINNNKLKMIKLPPLSRELLKNKIRNTSFMKIAKEYNVTDNTVRKWCDKYKLPRKVSIIKAISEQEWEYI